MPASTVASLEPHKRKPSEQASASERKQASKASEQALRKLCKAHTELHSREERIVLATIFLFTSSWVHSINYFLPLFRPDENLQEILFFFLFF